VGSVAELVQRSAPRGAVVALGAESSNQVFGFPFYAACRQAFGFSGRQGGPTASQHALRIALVLSRVHWVEPKLVAEITYLTWTADGLLHHTVYVGLREDKAPTDVRREVARIR
jgi:hypothetical protein